jgi:hypothetical protein
MEPEGSLLRSQEHLIKLEMFTDLSNIFILQKQIEKGKVVPVLD